MGAWSAEAAAITLPPFVHDNRTRTCRADVQSQPEHMHLRRD